MLQVNNIGAKERGTRRGNIVGLGSYERACRIVIYDLGLTEAQNKMLTTGFQESLGENAIIKPFKNELKQFPQHAQFSDRSHTNAYKVGQDMCIKHYKPNDVTLIESKLTWRVADVCCT